MQNLIHNIKTNNNLADASSSSLDFKVRIKNEAKGVECFPVLPGLGKRYFSEAFMQEAMKENQNQSVISDSEEDYPDS